MDSSRSTNSLQNQITATDYLLLPTHYHPGYHTPFSPQFLVNNLVEHELLLMAASTIAIRTIKVRECKALHQDSKANSE